MEKDPSFRLLAFAVVLGQLGSVLAVPELHRARRCPASAARRRRARRTVDRLLHLPLAAGRARIGLGLDATSMPAPSTRCAANRAA